MPRVPAVCLAGLLAVSAPSRLLAQESADSMVLSLDSLLNTKISSSAKYEQTISEAASSVTIITAEDIQRHGYRSLPEVLAATRGFYISNDRNYTFVGARGFSRPSDYNNRILLLIDGNVVNEGVFGSAPMGTELGVPMESLERIEIVRGPGAALYGTSAVFAVINLITRSPDGDPNLSGAVRAGSFGGRGGSLEYRGEVRRGLGLSLGGTWDGSDGQDLIYPEYAAAGTSGGVVHNKDWERRWAVFGKLQVEGVTLHGRYTARTKAIPTGAFSTDIVGRASKTRDDQGFVELKLDRALDPTRQVNARAYFNTSYYHGDYFREGVNNLDEANYRVVGGEASLNWDIASSNRLTVGGEVRHDLRAEYLWSVEPGSEADLPNTVASAYVQDEHQITRSLSLLAGVRHDAYETSRNATSPRLAAIFAPTASSTFKLLYGRAFRAPSLFEVMDGGEEYKANPDIRPEQAQTFEAVWQQRLSGGLLSTVSLFHYDMWDLIDFTIDPVDSLFVYRNIGDAKAYGFEAGVRGSFGARGTGYLSYSYQEATERATGRRLSNSPDHMLKAGLGQDLVDWLGVGIDTRYESSRRTLVGSSTDPVFLTDLHLLLPGRASHRSGLLERMEMSVKVNNLFDAEYATPGGPEHRQAAIGQDGRSLSAELRYRF
jgi:iron complex outermembrane receptor protein